MKKQNQAYVMAALAVLLWSTVATAFKLALKALSVYQLLLISSLVSLLCLFVLLALSKGLGDLKKLTLKDFGFYGLLGLINPFAYYLILFQSYDLLPAQVAQPLNYTWPVVLVLLSLPLLQQKMTGRILVSFLVCFVGVLFISTGGDLKSFQVENPFGVFLALISALFWAVYWLLGSKRKEGETLRLFLSFAFGSLYLIILGLFTGGWKGITWEGVPGAVYVGLFEMGLTFYFWSRALSLARNTASVSNLVYLSPFLSLLFIRFILGEPIKPATIAGLAIIVFGILLEKTGNRPKRRKTHNKVL